MASGLRASMEASMALWWRKRPLWPLDSDSIKMLARLLEETGLTEIGYQTGKAGVRVVKKRTQAAAPIQAQPQPTEEKKKLHVVTSTKVGTVHIAVEGAGTPFVQIGHEVSAGQILLT